eukprot:CAMPEP_0179368182 /NCGR_PEP_ID=MMETSP0797-20121207/83970_1 /TAXON_ID=47934 /ORGANISM="Dinophysis acuminata, Strain DAEP01" /LENGTH=50 /DNA_ID=CAMNT_0021083779 /DNA_START=79 /DNA_END=228 /DNA_ORIENTATION=-
MTENITLEVGRSRFRHQCLQPMTVWHMALTLLLTIDHHGNCVVLQWVHSL